MREQVRYLGLSPHALADVLRDLNQADEEMVAQSPNKPIIAERLKRVVGHLQRAGAIAAAGQALTTPLTHLAHWLGTLGASILTAL